MTWEPKVLRHFTTHLKASSDRRHILIHKTPVTHAVVGGAAASAVLATAAFQRRRHQGERS